MTQIHHFSSYGKRQEKYDLLNNTEFANVPWQELELKEPYYFFVPKDFGAKEKYDEGFSVSEIFNVNNSGVKTDRDSLFINIDKEKLKENFQKLLSGDYDNNFIEKYRIVDSGSFKITERIIGKKYDESKINLIQYRPFDYQYIYYDEKIVSRPGFKVGEHIVNRNNFSLITSRQFGGGNHFICFISNKLVEISSQPFAPYYQFPLYIYNQQSQKSLVGNDCNRSVNFNPEIIAKIEEKLGLHLFSPFFKGSTEERGEGLENTFTPTNLFDYIYAVLHSKTYRETYKEFLKIDFPKIPFDVSKETFFELARLGEKLRSYHLLENPNLIAKNFITKYEIDGNNKVEKVRFETVGNADLHSLQENGNLFINDTQYFSNVPKEVFEFYIGGYQPAQKWLKDRKDRNLNYEDILHYSKIILTLKETINIMKEIEKNFKI